MTQITTKESRTNKAAIIFAAPEPEAARRPEPHEFELPNGIGTYGIIWERGAGVLWVMQKGLVRKCDFTNPWQVRETRFAEGGIINIPEQMQEPLKKAFDVTIAPKQQPVSEKPISKGTPKLPKLPEAHPDVAHEGEWTGEVVNDELEFTLTEAVTPPPASEAPKTTVQEPFTAWGKEVGGLQAGLGFKAGEKRAFTYGETATLVVRVRNVSKEEVKFESLYSMFVRCFRCSA